MAYTCAGVRRSAPRSCFVKRPVEAPRQVQIGFDLSPKGENFGALTNLDDDGGDITRVNPHSNYRNPCLISSKAATTATTATSPRSALQQLLLSPVEPQSEPASFSPAANHIRDTHGPLLIEPVCKPQAARHSLTGDRMPISTKPYVEHAPVSTHGNWPVFKGIAELVGPTGCAVSKNDGRINGSSAVATVSAIKCVAGINGERCGWVRELPWRSERKSNESSRNIEDQLHEVPPRRSKSKKNTRMKEIMINNEGSYSQHEKSSNVEISWKQTSINIPDQRSRKSSLFTLGASSPAADYTKHCPLPASANMDMNFLNSCYLCKRVLGHGHDAFMYSGDKAFCSLECRYQQIVIDERRERCAPPVIRSGASPVYQSTGATAAATASVGATTHHPITINRLNFMNPTAAA